MTTINKRSRLEENGVSVKKVRDGIIYCYCGSSRYATLKLTETSGEEDCFTVTKEGLSGNEWGKDFTDFDEVIKFILDRQ